MMDEKAYNKAVAINMRRIMYEKGISQVDLAKALGYSKQSVSQWMNVCWNTFRSTRAKFHSKSFGTLHI